MLFDEAAEAVADSFHQDNSKWKLIIKFDRRFQKCDRLHFNSRSKIREISYRNLFSNTVFLYSVRDKTQILRSCIYLSSQECLVTDKMKTNDS